MIRRPTMRATVEESFLPLHAKIPHVKLLDWNKAYAMVEAAAPKGEESIFKTFAQPYLDRNAAARLFSLRDVNLDPKHDADLLDHDILTLLNANFCEPSTSTNPPTLVVFLVVEIAKRRRRVIGWPRSTIREERRRHKLLRESQASVPFADHRDCERAADEFFALADFTQFFQEFKIAESCREFFTFTFKGKKYQLTTLPTGGVGPPLIAEVLTRAICAAAVRLANLPDGDEFRVHFSTMIDNVRFSSNNRAALDEVWHVFVTLCNDIGITIGEQTPPSARGSYMFLGMQYTWSDLDGCFAVAAGPKIIAKLRAAKSEIRENHQFPFLDILAFFGVCFFVTFALQYQRKHELYMLIKFARRCARSHFYENKTMFPVWPSIIASWHRWIDSLLDLKFVPRHAPRNNKLIVAFSDASSAGWGTVILTDEQYKVRAGTFKTSSLALSINVKETIALRNAVQSVISLAEQDESNATFDVDLFVDNTSAISWAKKGRSSSFIANSVIGEMRELFNVCQRVRLRSIQYVPSALNLADEPSRRNQ